MQNIESNSPISESEALTNSLEGKKRNKTKILLGLFLMLLVIVIYSTLVALMEFNAGGGAILVIPVYLAIKYFWSDWVIQKENPSLVNPQIDLQNNNVPETQENLGTYTNKVIIKEDHVKVGSSEIKVESILNKPISINIFSRVINFLTFKSPTFMSILDEGQRRIVFLGSFILPAFANYLYYFNFKTGQVAINWFLWFPLFYIAFFVVLLTYIWLREGQGKVKNGGNALRTIRSFILSCIAIFLTFELCFWIYLSFNKLTPLNYKTPFHELAEAKKQPVEQTYNLVLKFIETEEYTLDDYRNWIASDTSALNKAYNKFVKENLLKPKKYSKDQFRTWLKSDTSVKFNY